MIITEAMKFKVTIAESREKIKSQPIYSLIIYYSGCEKTALHSAIGDIKEIGANAAFLIEKWHVPKGCEWADGYYTHFKGGEISEEKEGVLRYYPRHFNW